MSNTPEQTIQFRVYKNDSVMVGIASVDMPQISYMTESISGSHVGGEYDSPTLGLTGSMSCKLKWIRQNANFYDMLDSTTAGLLELRASMQEVDPSTGIHSNVPLRISMIASVKNSGLGALQTAKKQDSETELEVTRLLVSIGGTERLLIDKINMIHRVNGNDALAPIREDLGLDY